MDKKIKFEIDHLAANEAKQGIELVNNNNTLTLQHTYQPVAKGACLQMDVLHLLVFFAKYNNFCSIKS